MFFFSTNQHLRHSHEKIQGKIQVSSLEIRIPCIDNVQKKRIPDVKIVLIKFPVALHPCVVQAVENCIITQQQMHTETITTPVMLIHI